MNQNKKRHLSQPVVRREAAPPQQLRRAAIDSSPAPEVPPVVGEVLSAPGQPLDADTRRLMEPRFRHDFSGVRIHADGRAAASARAVNALAYTVGSDIVFGANRYAPGLPGGQRLLAHELAHVVQQAGVQGSNPDQLKIGDPSDAAEHAAHQAMRLAAAPAEPRGGSVALDLRSQLRRSQPAGLTLQRAVPTWAGEFDTDKYDLTKDAGLDGVDIELRFKPDKHVDAELIGLTQSARSSEKGVPFAIGSGKEQKALASRMIPAADPGGGAMIDRVPTHGNPLYAADRPGAGDTLAATPTVAGWGQHGWRYTDKTGTLQKQDALLKDRPQLLSSRKESGQVFESTALAVKGVQDGTFYGSVQWGWQKDAGGTVSKLPLTLVSKDVPSATFASASALWNAAKTSEGKDTVDLPIVTAKYTNTPGVWLVSNPSQYQATTIGTLAKNTRLEVTDKGAKKSFNQAAAPDQWWKVTIVEGTHIGKVGWVMQANLSDTPTK